MSGIAQLQYKHNLASALAVSYAQRKGLSPDDIVAMAFHTAELITLRIVEDLNDFNEELAHQEHEMQVASTQNALDEQGHAKLAELNNIIKRFIKENQL